jgi:hypothetical protein
LTPIPLTGTITIRCRRTEKQKPIMDFVVKRRKAALKHYASASPFIPHHSITDTLGENFLLFMKAAPPFRSHRKIAK